MEATIAARLAIAIAKRRGLSEITPDELLLGCFESVARFGVARIGEWTFDLEEFGLDWLAPAEVAPGHIEYSAAVVKLMDRAARIARADASPRMQLSHLLAAFAPEDGGLMGELKKRYRITNPLWRAAAASLVPARADAASEPLPAGGPDYLTPEQAAEQLGIHVQTMRAYIRTGRVPAFRIAGERALRIRRSDLEKVLEPLAPERGGIHLAKSQ